MTITHYVCNFFAGLFLCNCMPHLAAGLRGERFPTPFARPPGAGESAAIVNFLWGAFNFFLGIGLLAFRPIVIGPNLNTALFVVAFLLLGSLLSTHFAKVRTGKK